MPTCSRWRNGSKRFRFDPTVNVDRLRPYVVRAGAPAQPGPIPGAAHDVYEAESQAHRAVSSRTLLGSLARISVFEGHVGAGGAAARLCTADRV